MEEGIFPGYKSIPEEAGLEEERRLCYVGMTRAKERLFLTCSRTRTIFGSTSCNAVSRFMKEVPKEMLEGYEDIFTSNQENISEDNRYNWEYGGRTNSNLKAYTITAFHSDKVLDVAGAGQNNGTNVQQYQKNKSKAQQWIIQKTSDGYYSIISKCNYLFLDVSGASTKNGTNIQVYETNNSKAQKFNFEKINNITCGQVLQNGIYKISSALNGNKVLDISGGSTNNGANLQIWNSENVQQQKFQVT